MNARTILDSRSHSLRRACTALAVAGLVPIIAAAQTAPQPQRASRAESTGVAGGLLVGAAAAGPFGAIFGAATGGWLGDRFHQERSSARTARELRYQYTFRTGSTELQPEAVEQLQQVAKLARSARRATLRITGEADPRGDAAYNLELSRQRALAVGRVLADAGMPAERMVIEGIGAVGGTGATDAATPDLDGYAFARRVTVVIETS